jgi:hypothetical protein
MKFPIVIRIGAVAVLAAALLVAWSPEPAQAQLGMGQSQTLVWHRIFGIPEAFNVVGSGTGAVGGGAPWTTTSGNAKINLKRGTISFQVKGLVLAVGGEAAVPISGLQIGTPAGVTSVKGTVVCAVSGAGNGGNSVLVDTPAVPLSSTGDASFSGKIGSFPAACSTSDIAFLIRIVEPVAFGDLWIAAGGVLDPP